MQCRISLWSAGVSCPHLSAWHTPRHLSGREASKPEKVLLWKPSLAAGETSLCNPALFLSQIQNSAARELSLTLSLNQ